MHAKFQTCLLKNRDLKVYLLFSVQCSHPSHPVLLSHSSRHFKKDKNGEKDEMDGARMRRMKQMRRMIMTIKE